jgi:undecaprenyl diphosphate synthase
MTAGNTALQLHICFNYGSRDEITNAARRLAEQATAGLIEPAEITPEVFAAALATPDIPDPDLLIRTGSEVRLSNFLLWQLAYAELVFFDVAWPDFGRDHLEAAIAQYRKRTRRFGGLAVASG